MNVPRIRAEAMRDQAWASIRDQVDNLYRIAEVGVDVDDLPLIQQACAIVAAEIVYRSRVACE